jgi:hypothetical protein
VLLALLAARRCHLSVWRWLLAWLGARRGRL